MKRLALFISIFVVILLGLGFLIFLLIKKHLYVFAITAAVVLLIVLICFINFIKMLFKQKIKYKEK